MCPDTEIFFSGISGIFHDLILPKHFSVFWPHPTLRYCQAEKTLPIPHFDTPFTHCSCMHFKFMNPNSCLHMNSAWILSVIVPFFLPSPESSELRPFRQNIRQPDITQTGMELTRHWGFFANHWSLGNSSVCINSTSPRATEPTFKDVALKGFCPSHSSIHIHANALIVHFIRNYSLVHPHTSSPTI